MKKQLEFKKAKGWGGKRKGAGRKNRTKSVNHMKRSRIDVHHPIHVNQKLAPNLPSLRTQVFKEKLHGAIKAARKFGLRVIHFSILRNHIHLICEANSNQELGSGMRSLFGRISRIIRRLVGKEINGSVFIGRYFAKVIKDPWYMRRALEYVLFNKAKHEKLIEHIDSFSSAYAFTEWKALLGRRLRSLIAEQLEQPIRESPESMGLSPPKSWLASAGWMEAPAPA